MGIEDKSRVSQELVPFSGQLCDHLLQRVNSKSRQLALMAQVSPSLLEYLRNQVCTLLMHNPIHARITIIFVL